jgi:acetate---CoA ligase (ADP-forming)
MAAEPLIPPQAIRRLLNPRSVAIVGASATPGALGAAVIANLDRYRESMNFNTA